MACPLSLCEFFLFLGQMRTMLCVLPLKFVMESQQKMVSRANEWFQQNGNRFGVIFVGNYKKKIVKKRNDNQFFVNWKTSNAMIQFHVSQNFGRALQAMLKIVDR